MKKSKWILLCVLMAVSIALLSACDRPMPEVVTPSDPPSETVSQAPESSEPVSSPPAESEPEPTESEPAGPVVTVDGAELEAEEYTSPLSYTVLVPAQQVTVNAWDGGETFMVNEAEGTYLSICCLDAPSLNVAVAGLQFEYAIEGDPTGRMFGTKGYAGMSMAVVMDDLSIEYILCEEDGVIYLLELALYGEGAEQKALLDAMLDTFTIQS